MAAIRNITGMGTAATYGANLTRFAPIGGATTAITTETASQITYESAGVLSNLFIFVATNTVSAASTFRTRKNIANGAQSTSITASTTGIFEDNANTDSVVAGDEVNYSLVTGATGTSMTISQMATLFTATTNTTKKHASVVAGGSFSTASTTVFVPTAGVHITPATTEANVQYKSRIAGTINNFFVHISSNARTATTTVFSRKNTANGNLTVSIGSTATGFFEDLTHSDTIATGDLINRAFTTGAGTQNIIIDVIAAEFTTTTGSSIFTAGSVSSTTVVANNTVFAAADGQSSTQGVAEARSANKPQFSFTAANLQFFVTANTITASSTFSLRQNSGSSGISASIASSTTGIFEDLVNTAAIAATDLINYQLLIGATGANIQFSTMAITASTGSPPPPTPISFITYRPPWRS